MSRGTLRRKGCPSCGVRMKFYNVHCPYCDIRLWSFRLMFLVSLISIGMLVFVIGVALAADT